MTAVPKCTDQVARAVENFLDMGHFPYVHSGYLGIEPLTEVKEYEVDVVDGGREIIATEFEFFQPLGSRIETPVRSDKTSITYRRWLSDMGLTYCVIPAEA